MSQTILAIQPKEHVLMNRRGLIVIVGLFIQIVVIGLVIHGVKQPAEPSLALSPVAGNGAVCRVGSVVPFSEPWFYGLQTGDIVQITGVGSNPCSMPETVIRVNIAGHILSLTVNDTTFHNGGIPDTLLESLLTIIFTVTGISIFLRATNRPVARITYALFYCVSLIFSLLGAEYTNHAWISIVVFVLLMTGRGLSTTFVCLLPLASASMDKAKRGTIWPYVPLMVALAFIVVPLPLLLFWPGMRIPYILLTVVYNFACLVVVVWMLFRGLRNMDREEKRIAQVIIVGSLFLLLPLALSFSIIRTNYLVQPDLVRLLPVPLTVLPILYSYILFRHRLVGMASLVSRQVMRVLLWVLLVSLFVFPIVILLRFISTNVTNGMEIRVYVFAILLVVSLWLFPLLWGKVRDMGDHVFYRDFYQYNQSLSELSTAMTRLQGFEQISAFILPRLAQLLNVTDVALLVRGIAREDAISSVEGNATFALNWHIYRLPEGIQHITNERLTGVAGLALTHRKQKGQPTNEPLVLDGMLLLSLYDGDTLTGFLCLGHKKNLEPYSRQDTSFLTTLAAQLAVLEVNSRYLEQAQTDAGTLAALNHRVVSAQEDERRHLALELHDEALQQAMLLVRQLSDAGTMVEVAGAMPLARSLVSSLRHTCLELRPPLLDELGLEEALHWLARQTEQRGGQNLHITVSCEGLQGTRLPATVELSLYRVAQEALSNALKYAGASAISLRLRYRQDGIVALIIADNGCGFKQHHPSTESLGLLGMQERMMSIGGYLRVRSSTGRGVAIRATCAHQLLRIVA